MVATVSASLTVGSLVGEHRNLSRRAGTVLPREGHEGPPLRGTSPRHPNRAVASGCMLLWFFKLTRPFAFDC